MTEITTKTFPNGYKVVVSYDTDPQSPREWDNLGTVVIHNRSRYAFADETASIDELQELENDKNHIALPIYLYDHSGITINTAGFSCPWDSGQVGVIYCTKEAAVKEFGNKVCTTKVREKALKCLRGEIEELDQYLRGEVYGFEVFDPAGELVDSCWGFYGDVDYCLSEGVSYVEHCCREDDTAIIGFDHCCGEELLQNLGNR